MNSQHFSFILVFLLMPILSYAQNETNKGFSGNNLDRYAILVEEPSIYATNKHNCYALALGMPGPFVDKAFDTLKFPDDDCRAFLQAVNRQFRFQYDITEFSLLPVDNNKRYYREAFALLEKLSESTIYNGDIVFIYLSGHGITFRDHYFFPMRDSDSKSHSNMITGAQIIEVAENLANKGANVFIFLDTCASGSIYSELINLKGNGGVACFPAASKDRTTQERYALGSSEFGDRLRDVLSGDYATDTQNDLTTNYLLQSIKPTIIGSIDPRCYNSSFSKIENVILVKDVEKIRSYNSIVDKYNSYVDEGTSALQSNQYGYALKQFDLATSLSNSQKLVFPEDRQDLSIPISRLNDLIVESMKKKKDDSIWESLSKIDLNSPNLDKNKVSAKDLYLGCGYYYKTINDYENAYIYFLDAIKNGDLTNAPYEIYLITANNNVPSINPINETQRQEYLQLAADNNNNAAYKILHPSPISVEPIVSKTNVENNRIMKRLWDDITDDDPVLGISAVSDFKYFPIGIKGDFLWGPFHIGLDCSLGNKIFSTKIITYTSTQTIIINNKPVEPNLEYVGSENEKTTGVFEYTITPGLFYKYVSLDCGLGQIFTNTSRIDIYNYKYDSSTSFNDEGPNYSINTSSSTTSSGTKKESVDIKNNYFVFKPGLTAIIGDKYDFAVILSARYRICPQNKEFNGFELSMGLNIPL